MNWITENWALLLGIISIVCVCVASVVCFCRQPSSVQKAKGQRMAVVGSHERKQNLAGGTGALKLAMVYDLFVCFKVPRNIKSDVICRIRKTCR